MLIVAAACYLRFWQGRPIGTGPAGPQALRAAFSRPWTERQVLVAGLGDSITAGFGARHGYSYFDRLVANPPDEFEDMRGISLRAAFPNLKFTNLAVPGTTSGEHIAFQLPRLPTVGSNALACVVLTTGGNARVSAASCRWSLNHK